MIQYDPKSWWSLIFKFHKSDTFRKLLPAMLTVALFSAGVAYVDYEVFFDQLRGTSLVHSLLGFVISLLLVFRTNTAYERWWEGRRLWGQLVNASRNLALKLDATLPPRHPARRSLALTIAHYAETLSQHLRDEAPSGAGGTIPHAPNRLAAGLCHQLEALRAGGRIIGERYLALIPDLNALTDVCGACERIRKTPIPYSYSLFIKKFIFVYIVTMPFCFVHDFGYWTVLFSTFVFYVLASLELIAEEVENPFGLDANDLPTEEIARVIGRDVGEILGFARTEGGTPMPGARGNERIT
jgi:putative membrane protein